MHAVLDEQMKIKDQSPFQVSNKATIANSNLDQLGLPLRKRPSTAIQHLEAFLSTGKFPTPAFPKECWFVGLTTVVH